MQLTGQEIKRTREHVGESQEQFCVRLGIDQTTLSRWEKRGPPNSGPARKLVERVLAEVGQAAQ